MLTDEENALICQVGPGTAAGKVMREYWIPALLGSELPDVDVLLLGAREFIAEARRTRAARRQIAMANPPVIVLLQDEQLLHGLRMMAPAQRLIFQSHTKDHLAAAIDLALEGYLVIPERLLQQIYSGDMHIYALGKLTLEELSVFALIGQGMTNTQIATTMQVPVSRTKSSVRSVIGKLGMTNRTDVAVFYSRHVQAN